MNTQKYTKTEIRRSIVATSFVFLVISYGGWVYETLLCMTAFGGLSDRGFLRLPFCPIYGGAACAVGLLLGTPIEGNLAAAIGRIARRYGWTDGVAKAVRYAVYFLLSMLLATAVELIVGVIFQNLGYDLWSYANQPYNFKGVICPSISICWGFMMTIGMRYPYAWLMRAAKSTSEKLLTVPCVLLLVAMLADFILLLWL